jgi:flagellar biogenesis protein FliO
MVFPLLVFATTEVPSLGWLIFKTLLILVVLGFVMFFLFKYGGKWLQIPMFKQRDPGDIKINGVVSIEPRRTLFLVSVREREFLISSSETGIVLISETSPLPINHNHKSQKEEIEPEESL